MDYSSLTVKNYLEELSSNKPTPGGGSAAGVSISLSAALLLMVIRVTMDKPNLLLDYERELTEIRERAVKLITRDAEVFQQVVASFKLPQDNKEEKEEFQAVIEEALKKASLVPLECMKTGLRLLELAEVIIKLGNRNAIADAGVSSLIAFSAIKGSYYNIVNNTRFIKDECFIKSIRENSERILRKAGELTNDIDSILHEDF